MKKHAQLENEGLQAEQAKDVTQMETAELTTKMGELMGTVSGIKSPEVAHQIWSQLQAMALWEKNLPYHQKLYVTMQMMAELQPSNLLEALLAVQLVSVHEASLVLLRRALHEDQDEEGCEANVRRSARLMRLFYEQLGAMNKLKGRATQQKMTVEHVHVHSGAQAVVGVVNGRKGEGEQE